MWFSALNVLVGVLERREAGRVRRVEAVIGLCRVHCVEAVIGLCRVHRVEAVIGLCRVHRVEAVNGLCRVHSVEAVIRFPPPASRLPKTPASTLSAENHMQ